MRATVTGCDKSATEANIPEEYAGLPVTSIADGAFTNCSLLTSVSMPNTITYIGGAFVGCSALSSISISEGLILFGEQAFFGCSSLTSITLPESVGVIPGLAFGYCSALASVDLPSGLSYISEMSFFRCSSLASVIVPKSVTYIGYDAFWSCSGGLKIFLEASSSDSMTLGSDWSGGAPYYFYSESAQEGCWRYVAGVPSLW